MICQSRFKLWPKTSSPPLENGQRLIKLVILLPNLSHRTLHLLCKGKCITVRLTSCLTGLDLAEQVNLLLIKSKQSSWIQTSQKGGQLYIDTSPYSECSLAKGQSQGGPLSRTSSEQKVRMTTKKRKKNQMKAEMMSGMCQESNRCWGMSSIYKNHKFGLTSKLASLVPTFYPGWKH